MRKHRRRMRRIPHNEPFGEAYRKMRQRKRRRAEWWAFIGTSAVYAGLAWYALEILIRG